MLVGSEVRTDESLPLKVSDVAKLAMAEVIQHVSKPQGQLERSCELVIYKDHSWRGGLPIALALYSPSPSSKPRLFSHKQGVSSVGLYSNAHDPLDLPYNHY